MADGVVEATENAFKRHPALIIGGLVGVVALLYIFSSSGSSSAGTTVISYPIGPSDAAVQAGTALQIAQAQANSANSIATTQATAATAQTQSLLDYLTNKDTLSAGVTTQAINSGAQTQQLALNNQLTADLSNIQGQVSIAGINQNAAVQEAGLATQAATNYNDNAANVAINNSNNSTAVQMQQLQVQNNLGSQTIASNDAAIGSILSADQANQQATQQYLFSAIGSGQPQSYLDSISALGEAFNIPLVNGGQQTAP